MALTLIVLSLLWFAYLLLCNSYRCFRRFIQGVASSAGNPNEHNHIISSPNNHSIKSTSMEQQDGINVQGDYIKVESGATIVKVAAGGTNNIYQQTSRREMTYAEKMKLLPDALQSVRGSITNDRLWFPICKAVMQLKLVGNGDFKNAISLISESLPEELRPKDVLHDIQKLDALSLARDVDQWDKNDSPVGKHTPEYQTLYRRFMAKFE